LTIHDDKLKFVEHDISSPLMFIKFLGSIWRHLPGSLRRRLVRVGQRRFTVSVGATIFDDKVKSYCWITFFGREGGWGILVVS